MRRTWIGTAGAVGLLALAGCGGGTSYGSGSGTSSAAGSTGSRAAATADLATWQSPVGPIVVDGKGRAVYVFAKDTVGSGTSACSGACAQNWPAVTTSSGKPTVSGVTGTVGTLTRADGTHQVTLDGHPLYEFAGDAGPGSMSGQGVQGVWWVVSPSGTEITKAATSPSSSSSSSSSGGYSY